MRTDEMNDQPQTANALTTQGTTGHASTESVRNGEPRGSGGKPGRSGPPGNAHAQRHGVFGFLAIGRLPKGASYIRRLLSQLRKALETAVRDTHGDVSVYHGALIQSAIRHEGRALLATRYLRQGDDVTVQEREASHKTDQATSAVTVTTRSGLTLADRMTLLREIASATDSRDKCLQRLGLDKQSSVYDVFAGLHAARAALATTDEPEAASVDPGATENDGAGVQP